MGGGGGVWDVDPNSYDWKKPRHFPPPKYDTVFFLHVVEAQEESFVGIWERGHWTDELKVL